VAGFLLERELQYLSSAVANPERPFVAVLGGAKISGKIDVLTNLMDKADAILVGGGMAYTFFVAQGQSVGNSLVEDSKVDLAREILAQAKQAGVDFLLPVDNVVADAFSADANTKIAEGGAIPDGWEGLDIGPKTIAAFTEALRKARTVVWNGPLGCFEMEPFAAGTMAIAKAIAEVDGVKIIGGGDSVSAINRSGVADKMTHISTGGGASLELLEGKELPGVAVLSNA
jgi:phosphoglycerate kinase